MNRDDLDPGLWKNRSRMMAREVEGARVWEGWERSDHGDIIFKGKSGIQM